VRKQSWWLRSAFGYSSNVKLVMSLAAALVCVTLLPGCGMEAGPTIGPSSSLAAPDSVRDSKRNAIAWAPLADPNDIVVEGSVPRTRAWSTSKVLVIAAYLDSVVDGDPDKIPAQDERLIRAALSRSDEQSIIAIRHRVPRCGTAMSRVLRSIGDTTTKVPDSFEGTMQWTLEEQVKFMAAIGNGELISPRASSFLLRHMQPIASQRWGLGIIGSRAFKPGWMTAQTESRQMGIVGDFAVAIITSGADPNAPSDPTHASQLNRLALLLATRIEDARCLRSNILDREVRWC
jgi:hypothetical protein